MDDLDDDAPPPLSSLAEQVEAVRLRENVDASSVVHTAAAVDESLRVANVVVMAPKPASKPPAPAIKRGFFDAPKQKPKPKAAAPSKPAAEDIPMIRAKQPAQPSGGPSIPDFLRVEPDEQEIRYRALRQEMLDKLKPTPDTVADISKNPELLGFFNDPEVMAAVNDVAANPQNMKKYKNNAKVQAFYAAMGQLMGQKLEKMGGIQGPAGQPQQGQRPPPANRLP